MSNSSAAAIIRKKSPPRPYDFCSYQSKVSAISACAAGSKITRQVTGARQAIVLFGPGFYPVQSGHPAKLHGVQVRSKRLAGSRHQTLLQIHPTGLPPIEGARTCQDVQRVAVLISCRKV